MPLDNISVMHSEHKPLNVLGSVIDRITEHLTQILCAFFIFSFSSSMIIILCYLPSKFCNDLLDFRR